MWRSIFLHEFLDHNIHNFQSISGSVQTNLSLSSGLPTPIGTNAAQIAPGRAFSFVLDEPLDEIIGISGTILLRKSQSFNGPVPIIRIGDIVMLLRTLPNQPDGTNFSTTVQLMFNGATTVDIGTAIFPFREFVEISIEWHTSGQTRLLQNGRLIGYQNAVLPTTQLNVADVLFGLPTNILADFGILPNAPNPRYQIGYVFVRTLRRTDPLAALSRLLPDVTMPDDPMLERCRILATRNLLEFTQKLRPFMAKVSQTLSQNWTEANGPPVGPFSDNATQAHQLAMTALVELGRMQRLNDFSNMDAFLEPFGAFMRILRDTLPQDFKALFDELKEAPALPDECAKLLDDTNPAPTQVFAPMIEVIVAATEEMRRIAEGA